MPETAESEKMTMDPPHQSQTVVDCCLTLGLPMIPSQKFREHSSQLLSSIARCQYAYL